MIRLIDAWKLCEYANNLKDKQVDANDIMRFPTVDAEPIRHGHWVEQEQDDWRYSKEYRCSECGKYRLVTNPVGWEWHYCPNCGAKMDEPTFRRL